MAKPSRVGRDVADQMAAAVNDLLTQHQQALHSLRQREAELATGIPVVSHRDESRHLAARLEAVLKGGAEAVGCQAAALYLLDEATSQLKLRCSWGLPPQRLIEPARPLRGAIADLEALTGHAVVLEDYTLFEYWKAPEQCFRSAVCVPVASPTIPLGTLWLFCDEVRPFTDQQTNLAEITAGRLAADLDREILLSEGVSAKRLQQQWAAVARLRDNQLPRIAPLVDDWQVAARLCQAEPVGGAFYDWFVPAGGSLAIVLGNALGVGLEAALTATSLQAALKAHGRYPHNAKGLLSRVSYTLWTASAGDQRAALFYATIQPRSGRVEYATAGRLQAMVLRIQGCDVISEGAPPLAADPDVEFKQTEQLITPGDALVVIGGTAAARPGADEIAEALGDHRRAPADQIVQTICDLLGDPAVDELMADYSVLVAKRS